MKQINYFMIFFIFILPVFAGTRIWEHAIGKDFEAGEFKGTQLASDGTVRFGFELQKNQSPEASIWSYVYSEKGELFLGTGTRGIIYRFQDGKFSELYQTGALLVTSMVIVQDFLYAATIPEGKIFQINLATGEGKLWHKLPAGYIWGLGIYQNALIAGTGPEGILYQISFDPIQEKVLLKTEEKHILCLATDKNDNIYLGTEPNGLLIRVSPDGKAFVLADLVENEIRSIALGNGKIYLGANVTKNFDNTKLVQNLAREIEQQASQGKPINRKELLQKMTSGAIYEYQENTGVRSILPLPKNTVTTLASYQNGVLIGTGMDGYVYHATGSEQVTLFADLREDQVMSLIIRNQNLEYLGTGDTGIVYKLASPADVGYYYSPIMDATGLAKWGRITTQKRGDLILQTRSGNTQNPNLFWSEWSYVAREKITSPIGRYLQYRVGWKNAEGTLENVRIYYDTINRTPTITSFKIEGPKEDNLRLYSMKHDKKLKISWKGEDEDKDELIYRLYYRNVELPIWYDLTEKELLTKPNFTWDTAVLPDGYYVLRITASDESDNIVPTQTSYISKPILVDNNSPYIVAQRTDNKIVGKAYDSFSCIAQIAYRIGYGEWKIICPNDEIYDDSTENFTIVLENNGEIVEIQAVDSNNNIGYRLIR